MSAMTPRHDLRASPRGRLVAAAVAIVLSGSLVGCASAGRTSPATGAVLAAMPAADADEETRLSGELLALGDDAILEVCGSLVPMGSGDDTAARFALAGLSTYVTRPGAEEERQAYAAVLLQALSEGRETEVQAFFIRQLELVGGDESVAGVGRHLADAELVDPATKALVAIGTPSAQAALLAALVDARGASRATLVKALGELRTKAAVYEVMKYALSEDEDLRQAALYALANIGPVTSDDLLAEAATTDSPYRRSQATSYLLLYARRSIEAGEVDRGAQICRDLISTRTAPEERNVRIAALNTLVEMLGDGALEDVVGALDIPDPELTDAVLRIGAAMPGATATDAWLGKLQTVDGELHDQIRSMLLARSAADSSPRLENAKAAWAIAEAGLSRAGSAGGAAEDAGFTTLFNGTDLTGWQGDTTSYVAEDGMIVIHPELEGGGGNLYTDEQYADFVFRFEFRLTPGANNGLGIRAPLEGDAAYVGMELQILDNRAEQYADLRPYQYHGSIYGTVAAKRGFQKPPGEWNTQEVIALGRRVIVILNGTVIVDADIDLASTPTTPDGRDHPGLRRRRGHIGFLGHGSKVEFRSMRIREIFGPDTVQADASAQQAAQPVFLDGQAQIVEAFADPDSWIREELWVEATFDSDDDGKPDRLHVGVVRPRQTATEGLEVPVIYESSPYFSGTSGQRQYLWDVRQEVGAESPPRQNQPAIEANLRTRGWNSQVDNWVPRGFAVVHSEAPGTGLSQGCPTIGGPIESAAPKAVIDWLNGRAKGFSSPYGDEEVTADWATGKVGMTGTSYNGTLPVAAASTGVEGLEAIIPIAPNNSYYRYYRANGLVRHPGGWLGEDIDFLYDFVNSGNPERRDYCNATVRDGEMAEGMDRVSGDYNDFWAGRDLLREVDNIRAATLMAHAFNDWNVKPEHSVLVYEALKRNGVPHQAYFHQGGHGGAPPFEMMNRWFTRYLYGVENGVENDPKAWIVREGDERSEPTPYADYPNPDASPVTLYLTAGGVQHGGLALTPNAGQGAETLVDNYSFGARALAQAEWTNHRLLYVSPELTEPVHLSGWSRITVRLASSKPAANLSVYVVSLPWVEGGRRPRGGAVTRGWADPQNHSSLTDGEPLVPGRFYDLTFDLQPDDEVIAAGQRIGLMIFSSDRDFTLWPEPGTELSIDLDATSIELPVVGGAAALRRAFDQRGS